MNCSTRRKKILKVLSDTSLIIMLFVVLTSFWGCATNTGKVASQADTQPLAKPVNNIQPPPNPVAANTETRKDIPPTPFRPEVTWQPSYTLEDITIKGKDNVLPSMRVGANIKARGGNVTLREVINGLANLKKMNVSWASDVDQSALVDVNINAEDDFWTALSNLLKQLDYFYEFKDNTIFIKYKETRRFYVPVPFLTGSYKSSVGGNLIGSGEATGSLKGTISLENKDMKIDLWDTIEKNLTKILKLATTQVPVAKPSITPEEEQKMRDLCRQRFPSRPAQQALCVERARAEAQLSASTARSSKTQEKDSSATGESEADSGLREGFFFTIDKPLGIITVTAPRSLLDQVETYINALKKELSRQVIIEAKILEVRLDKNSQRGIDWSDLVKDSTFSGQIIFGGPGGKLYPTKGVKFISEVDLFSKSFTAFLNAIKEYGDVKVLSNPKLSLINGLPAMLTVGESVRYIDNVSSTVDSETGIVTYSVETRSVLSGIGFSVLANIASDNEVVLHLTPVTSQLQEPIEYRSFGSADAPVEVGLPRINLRELTTMAKVKSGQILIIGGLIDDQTGTVENKVPILGDIPFIGTAFKNSRKFSNKRELIILLKPEVVNLL